MKNQVKLANLTPHCKFEPPIKKSSIHPCHNTIVALSAKKIQDHGYICLYFVLLFKKRFLFILMVVIDQTQ